MKRHQLFLWGAVALAGVCLAGSGPMPVQAQPPAKTDSTVAATNSAVVSAKAPAPKPTEPKHELTGAELYSINCNRCHQERYPTERTGAQWKTIMLHMQVRANIPVSQAKLILQYLQENSGR